MTAVVLSLFPDEYPSFPLMLPTADLIPYLERACLQHTCKGFARLLVHRIGGNYQARLRLIERIKSGEQPRIQEHIADELACGLGLNAENIWPGTWSQPIDTEVVA